MLGERAPIGGWLSTQGADGKKSGLQGWRGMMMRGGGCCGSSSIAVACAGGPSSHSPPNKGARRAEIAPLSEYGPLNAHQVFRGAQNCTALLPCFFGEESPVRLVAFPRIAAEPSSAPYQFIREGQL